MSVSAGEPRWAGFLCGKGSFQNKENAMEYPTVIVNGVSVRVDEGGRYNLNDLHAAAVANGEATESQRPSNFLRSAQIKRFISALKAKAQKRALVEIQPLKVIKGGADSGVWGG